MEVNFTNRSTVGEAKIFLGGEKKTTSECYGLNSNTLKRTMFGEGALRLKG